MKKIYETPEITVLVAETSGVICTSGEDRSFTLSDYDEEGNYLSTALGHLPMNVGMYGLEVTQEDISDRNYEYYGVLYDVLNRVLKTEVVKHEKQ